jgi:hypothetical protein
MKPSLEEVKKTFEKVEKTGRLARARAKPDKSMIHVRAEVVPMSSLSQLLDEKIGLEKAIDVLLAQMDAETVFYDLTAKELVTRPDGKTRLAAVELFLAYREGRPIERKIIETHNVDSLEDVEKKLASSPAMREEFKRMIAAAEAKAQSENTPMSP